MCWFIHQNGHLVRKLNYWHFWFWHNIVPSVLGQILILQLLYSFSTGVWLQFAWFMLDVIYFPDICHCQWNHALLLSSDVIFLCDSVMGRCGSSAGYVGFVFASVFKRLVWFISEWGFFQTCYFVVLYIWYSGNSQGSGIGACGHFRHFRVKIVWWAKKFNKNDHVTYRAPSR